MTPADRGDLRERRLGCLRRRVVCVGSATRRRREGLSHAAQSKVAAGARQREHRPGAAIHLHPTAELAERVLLPGDPGRALALAQSLLEQPRMFNHNRGLWGYTGDAADGQALTIQATGMGGPSAAIVLAELIALGARRAIRVGTCGALSPALALGELVIARESVVRPTAPRARSARASAWPPTRR